jgi:adenine-specific DNA-methyltransferase
MQKEYKEQIKCIYIDPPYNTGNNGFVYKDSYQSASWLSMMYNRLLQTSDLMVNDGILFTSIDNNEFDNLKKILDNVFSPENFLENVIRQHSIQSKAYANRFS